MGVYDTAGAASLLANDNRCRTFGQHKRFAESLYVAFPIIPALWLSKAMHLLALDIDDPVMADSGLPIMNPLALKVFFQGRMTDFNSKQNVFAAQFGSIVIGSGNNGDVGRADSTRRERDISVDEVDPILVALRIINARPDTRDQHAMWR